MILLLMLSMFWGGCLMVNDLKVVVAVVVVVLVVLAVAKSFH